MIGDASDYIVIGIVVFAVAVAVYVNVWWRWWRKPDDALDSELARRMDLRPPAGINRESGCWEPHFRKPERP
jgi:hypothetical protein